MAFSILKEKGMYTSSASQAFTLAEKSAFGEKKDKKVLYTPYEVAYLLEKKGATLETVKKPLSPSEARKIVERQEKGFSQKYTIYKDLREKGHIPKTGLRFGADFRLYKKGTRPKSAHAPWLVIVIEEREKLSPTQFAAHARVAHSTKKKLLLAVVDTEDRINYYEVGRFKP